MHLSVAVQAGIGEQELRPRFGRARRQLRPAAVANRGMAGLAEVRRSAHQQRRLVGTVRLMADAAIFGGWRVLPQKRPAQFGVTARAGFVASAVVQQRLAAVRVVAVAADQLVAAHGMRGSLQHVCADPSVTANALRRLVVAAAHGIRRCMHPVAVGARHAGLFVRTAGPLGAAVVRMAGEAKLVLQVCRRVATLAEVDNRFTRRAVAKNALPVVPSRSMAGFALQAGRKAAVSCSKGEPATFGWPCSVSNTAAVGNGSSSSWQVRHRSAPRRE